MAFKIDRVKYNSMFGPTVEDKIRLGDTEIFVEIEKDYTLYGEEIVADRRASCRERV